MSSLIGHPNLSGMYIKKILSELSKFVCVCNNNNNEVMNQRYNEEYTSGIQKREREVM